MENFFCEMGELNYKADCGMSYKEMYDDFYIESLKKLCKKHDIVFDEKDIDWEYCNYIGNKQHEIRSIYEEECEILNNMTNNEKFKIMCKIKDIDIDEIGNQIYKTIESSNYEDIEHYLGICCYEDESMNLYDEYCLYLDYDMLTTFDDWAKNHMEEYDISYEECKCLDWESYVLGDLFNDEEKEFIKLALKYNVDSIVLRWL